MILNKRIPLTYPFKLVRWDLLYTILFATAIHFFSIYVISIKLPINIGAFLGTAIALILSFKLSQSYDRWWEARKIWGAIVNDSRTLTIQLLSFSGLSISKDIVRQMGLRQIAWCYALGQSLRKKDALEGLNKFLSSEELEEIKQHSNVPLGLINKQCNDLCKLHKDGLINDYQQIQIDSTLVRLNASMGMVERIKNTVFPKPYRLTLQFFIYLFLIILSLSLTELQSFIEIPILVVISLPFFLLEKIAFNMQDPFENRPTDTAMTSIARTIEINIKQLLKEDTIPEALPPEKFYSL